MKLVSVINYEKNAYMWIATFSEYSKQHPIYNVLFGDGTPTYIDNGDIIKRRKFRGLNEGWDKCNKDTREKLTYYLLYGDSTNINVNLDAYKKVFKV